MMGKRYQHLCFEERVLIQTQLSLKIRPCVIAAGLGRSATTILREIRRNGWRPELLQKCGRPSIAGRYNAVGAQSRARRKQGRPPVARKLQPGTPLWELVLKHLGQGLSPAQITRTLALMADPVRLSHETIYTSLYAMPRGELRSAVLDLLRHGHKTYRFRSPPDVP